MPRVLLAAAAVAVLLPATAGAATVRHAVPGGPDAGPCTPTAPCSLEYAVEGAADGDSVVVGAGTYTEADVIESAAAVDVASAPGPRAVLETTAGLGLATRGTVRDLEVRASATDVTAVRAGAGLERVVARATGSGGTACTAGRFEPVDVLVTDSTCLAVNATGALKGTGLRAFVGAKNLTLRNVTALGGLAGADIAVLGEAARVRLVNSVVRGTSIDVNAPATRTTATHSNFATVNFPIDGDANQTAPPLFADPPAGDVHQLPGSPTRNAGTAAEGLGATDLDGDPRLLEGAPDIGSDEAPGPPVAASGSVRDLTTTSVTLLGTAGGQGYAGTVRFEVTGPRAPAPVDQPLGAGTQDVAQTLTGLQPATRYAFRTVATTSAGTATGGEVTFTTATPPDVTAPVFSDLALTAARFRTSGSLTPTAAQVAPKGTTLLFGISEAADVRIAVQRLKPGRRAAGGACRAGGRRGRACTVVAGLGRLERAVGAGLARVRFTGRFGTRQVSKRLQPGRYRFSLTATDAAGNRSAAARVGFRVVR